MASPMQRVLRSMCRVRCPLEDLSALPGGGARGRACSDGSQDRSAEPFDLARGPLFRARLYRLAGDEHVLFFMPHHIIWDGWSFDLFYEEMRRSMRRIEPWRSPRPCRRWR